MAEQTKKRGPKPKYSEAVIKLAHDLYYVEISEHGVFGMSAQEVAKAINAKEICGRIEASQVPYIAGLYRKVVNP